MPRLGRETFDVPCVKNHVDNYEAQSKLENEAQEYLEEALDGFAYVRKVMNPHDFGLYPSFEIDEDCEFTEALDSYEDDDEIDIDLDDKRDKWWTRINQVCDDYGKKFEEYL